MLHVQRAERADRLADGLAETLLEPLEDAFTPEVVAVPTRGIERWLTQRLSTRLGTASAQSEDGVCANVEFPFPGRLIMGALAAATGIEPDDDPWLPERSVWPLLEVVDECLTEPWLATLERHLKGARGGPDDPPRRFGVVRHIADLFDRYGVHRPDMVRAWATGEDGGWQAELWRRLRARIGRPSGAERLSDACERIRRQPDLLDLPARLSLFGLTRLPRSYVEVLSAIADRRDVHMFVLHPSPVLWKKVAEHSGEVTNRLLASWGRDSREMQLVLAGAGAAADHHHELGATEPSTLLERIQADIRADRQPAADPTDRAALDPSDRSIQIHSCHGRARQVEVLRDAILHLLDDDPTLEPRDVIVMCPDIETFAPLIQATFGAGRRPAPAGDEYAEADGNAERATPTLPDLRVRLADRSLRQTNPILTVVSQLLELADQRATASQLLDLAAREPVRRRFGFDDDELSQMQDWVAASGIRWGFDGAHREPFQLAGLRAGTWSKGLDRVLAGVTMTEEGRQLVAGVLPLDDVESGAIDLAGRMAEYVERIRTAVDSLATAQPLDAWTDAIRAAADALTATSEREAWQRRELDRILDDVLGESTSENRPSRAELELADVRALLADRLKGRPTRANFRTGHLTFCTLVPMRSVPHRVVCVLGLDDGEFPRRAHRDGDDLMLQDPRVGDRDPRSEDRQMLLDALLAATERLIITYTGNDERTNVRRPPAVPVGELLDVIERTAGHTARQQVLTCHPLQPFDPRNFTPGELTANAPWGFDPHSLAGARALTGHRTAPRPFLPARLPPITEPVIELDRLVRFVERPIRALLRDRLGILVRESYDEVQDALPVEIDGLERWGIGQRLLEGVLAGVDLDACVRAEQARGLLPPGQLGIPVLTGIRDAVREIAACAAQLGGADPVSLDVLIDLPGGRALAGTVAGVCHDTLRVVSYARVKPRDRLRAWVWLLALTASFPDRPFEAVVIGRARMESHPPHQGDVTVARIPTLAEDPAGRRATALGHLTRLIDLYGRGMREVLPLASETSAAFVEGGEDRARRAWTSDWNYEKEDRQPEHVRAFGGQTGFDELLARPGFAEYAHRLWDPLLAVEELSDR